MDTWPLSLNLTCTVRNPPISFEALPSWRSSLDGEWQVWNANWKGVSLSTPLTCSFPFFDFMHQGMGKILVPHCLTLSLPVIPKIPTFPLGPSCLQQSKSILLAKNFGMILQENLNENFGQPGNFPLATMIFANLAWSFLTAWAHNWLISLLSFLGYPQVIGGRRNFTLL